MTLHFGVDNYPSAAAVPIINALNAKSIGYNGLTWKLAEPHPGQYNNTAALAAISTSIEAAGSTLQLNFRPDHDEMMIPGEGTYADPVTGLPVPRLLRIGHVYEASWKAIIKKIASEIRPRFLQIGSEAETMFEVSPAGAAGLARAVSLAWEAIQAVDPTIKVLAAGWGFDDAYLLTPSLQAWILANGTKTDINVMNNFLTRLNNKQTFVTNYLAGVGRNFDVMTVHLNFMPAVTPYVVGWLRSAMTAAGVGDKPIWVDDALSTPHYSLIPTICPQADLDLQDSVIAGDPTALTEWEARQSISVVERACRAFDAGVERIWFTWSTDLPGYFLPLWAVAGFLHNGTLLPKPAYYAYKQLIAAIDNFSAVSKPILTSAPTGGVYKFQTESGPIIVAWSDGASTVDLRGALHSRTAKVVPVVTTLSGQNPVYPAELTGVPMSQVPLNDAPSIISEEPIAHRRLLRHGGGASRRA